MYKKTLLALSIAAVASFNANASVIAAGIKHTAAIQSEQDAINTATPYTTCAAAAAAVGATLTPGGSNDTALDDTVTFVDGKTASGATTYDTGANVAAFTGLNACSVTINSDVLLEASDVASSLEGSQNFGTTVNLTVITGIGGYNEEDTIVFTVSGGSIDATASAAAGVELSDPAGNLQFGILGVNAAGTQISFNGVEDGTTSTAATALLALNNLVINADDGVTDIKISSQAQTTSSFVYDTGAEKSVTTLKSQFAVKVLNGFDGIIDVADNRVNFEVNSKDSNSADVTNLLDTAEVEVKTVTSIGNIPVNEVNFDFSGDFSWLAGYVPATATTAAAKSTALNAVFKYAGDNASAAASVKAGTMSLSTDNKTLSFTASINNTDGVGSIAEIDETHTFTVDLPATAADRDQVLSAGPYTVKVTAADTTTNATAFETVLADGASVGAWTLNGSVVTIPYMPFDANTKVIMRHTNTGSQEGDITIRYMLEDSSAVPVATDWVELDSAVAFSVKGVQDIRDDVINGIIAKSGVTSGKVAIEITTNVPSDDVTVFAGFKVVDVQDRGIVGTFGALGSAQND
jgi:hypothetical protein